MGMKVLDYNITRVNICVEVKHLGRIYQSGDIDVFPKLSMAREPTTDRCKSQGTQMNLESYPRINDLKSMG